MSHLAQVALTLIYRLLKATRKTSRAAVMKSVVAKKAGLRHLVQKTCPTTPKTSHVFKEMKTLKEIATTILERRQRMNPTVMQGEMNAVLGEDGLQEALNRRWLVPNYEDGYLHISPQGSVVEEMQAIAAMPDPTPAADTLGESRTICTQHAFRNAPSLMEASVLSEIAAPATGKGSPGFVQAPSMSTPTAPAAAIPAAAPNPAAGAPPAAAPAPGTNAVGEDVSVVQDGKTYQGKVASVQNGRYRLSFGGPERPQDREYSAQELNRVQPIR
jgi:hypothetical protein